MKNDTILVVTNLLTGEVEINLGKGIGGKIMEFKVFGKNEDQIIAITDDGYLILYKIDYLSRNGWVETHYKISLLEERKERLLSIAVCKESGYALVEIEGYRTNARRPISSRMMVFEVRQGSLIWKRSSDQFDQDLKSKHTLQCEERSPRGHILWTGLTKEEDGFIQVFDYEIEAEFIELVGKRVRHQVRNPIKSQHIERKAYYSGSQGKVMRYSLDYSSGANVVLSS